MSKKFLKYIAGFLFMASIFWSCKQNTNPQIMGHSHNDYEHTRPLFDALDCHFKSIEADVFPIGDSLFVAHNFEDIEPGRTLRNLYLNPLMQQIEENNGSVYGDGEEVILFVDIKESGLKTYQLLHQILENYKSVLTEFNKKETIHRSIMVVVSGDRPFEYMKNQAIRYAGYDGRLSDLDSGISSSLMPIVSNNWSEYFKWDGTGEMPEAEMKKLNELAQKAEEKGYLLRFWGTPNKTQNQRQAVWTELKKANVGLIGTDHLKELQHFFITNNRAN